MQFIQLNEGWNAEPNAPGPRVEIAETTLRLYFRLNRFVFKPPAKSAVLTFTDCLQYRLGPPNDEGFYVYGQSRFKKYGVKWGEFYRVENSDWQHDFPDRVIIDRRAETKEDHHFLFYFRDETFECVAKAFSFEMIKDMPKLG